MDPLTWQWTIYDLQLWTSVMPRASPKWANFAWAMRPSPVGPGQCRLSLLGKKCSQKYDRLDILNRGLYQSAQPC